MSNIVNLNIVPTFHDSASQTLNEFRSEVCSFIQTRINVIANKEHDSQPDTEFEIVWQSEVIANVKFDIRTMRRKITETNIRVTPLGDRALSHTVEAQSALAASYFVAGVAGRS